MAPLPQEITLPEARLITLAAQGLLTRGSFGQGLQGTLSAIRHLGYVQIDTISVVERAHHHTLWSRVPGYEPAHLERLQHENHIFEYWSHAAAFLPIEDYRYCLPRMKRLAERERHWFRRNRKTMSLVLDRIRCEGPLRSQDFEAPPGKRSGPWFDWKPAKRALEQLYMQGDLMVRERRGFQKVYDLTERALPTTADTRFPTPEEQALYLIESAARSHGIFQEVEARYLRRGVTTLVARTVRNLTEEGRLLELRVKGVDSRFYATRTSLEAASRAPDERVSILSPFDNAVIQRKRLQNLFDFDYLIECYVPAPKRKYGYFCLPLLWQGRLIGRIDAKADRNERVLIVHQTHWEPWLTRAARAQAQDALAATLQEFALFNGCEVVRPKKLSRAAARP